MEKIFQECHVTVVKPICWGSHESAGAENAKNTADLHESELRCTTV